MGDAHPSVKTDTFLTGGGDMGALMRAHDWSTSPLGKLDTWPQSLRTAVSLMIESKHPMFIAWGPQLAFLYNDGYVPIFGKKHPHTLGLPFREVWSEIWDEISVLIARALAGEATWSENLHLVMERNGFPEDTWYTFSYSPLRDESGAVAGMFCACTETTGHVLAERQLRDSEARFRALVNASSDVIYRMSSDWAELRELDGRGFLPDNEKPSVRWLDDYVFPEDRPRLMALVREAVRTKGVYEFEHRVRRADGTNGWTFSRAVPVLGAEEEIVEWFGMASDVTDRRNAQERLAESEREMRFALKAGRFGAWSLDLVTGQLTTSETCRTNFGRSPDAPFSYADLRDTVHPEDKVRMAESVERSIATGTDYDIEYRIVTPVGETRWIAIRAQPIYATEGTALSMAGVSIDVTERKRTEQRLTESEARYRTLFENIDTGFCVIEVLFDDNKRPVDYRFLEVNPAFAVQTDLENAVGRRMREFAPGHEQHWFDLYGAIALTGTPQRFENEAAALGRWYEVDAFRVGDPEQRRVAVLFNDVTVRRNVEQRLRKFNESLEQQVAERTAERDRVWKLSRDPLLIADAQGRWLSASPAWTDILGWSETELVGRTSEWMEHPDDRQKTRAEVEHLAAGGVTMRFENRFRTKDGDFRWFAWTAVKEGAFLYATARDVTADKQKAAELAIAQEALRQSQKMEAMGTLTGGVAHDFNNLLTPIVGALDMLQRKALGGQREQRLIAGAAQSADRAKTLVQRLLAFARRQPLQPTAVDLAPLVKGMADLISSTTGPQIKVAVHAGEGLPLAKADPNQLEMAILNLAVNARDAMPNGGTLSISVEAETIGRQHRAGVAPGKYLKLVVADTGVGMDDETLKRAVEPFFSTKGIGKGTGLGLSMVHGLASQLGGALTISSARGLGTNIELWLPQSTEPQFSTEPTREIGTAPPGRGMALLVDDEDLVRISTADMLIELGYAVVEAASAEQALELIEQGLHPDVLVTDHLMPGMSGTELARKLQKNQVSAKVLIVSGYAEADGIDPDLPRLTKPFRNADLAASLASLGEATGSANDPCAVSG